MQTLEAMWSSSPGGFVVLAMFLVLFMGHVVSELVSGLVTIIRGHKPIAPAPTDAEVDDEDDDEPGDFNALLSDEAVDKIAETIAEKLHDALPGLVITTSGPTATIAPPVKPEPTGAVKLDDHPHFP